MIDAISLLSVIVIMGLWIRALVRLNYPDAAPPSVTRVGAPLLQPGARKDGMHRPGGGERRSLGRLIAWAGAIRRAP